MQKLKAGVYLKNNKKRAFILILSFGLLFSLLYGVRFFLAPSNYMDEVLMVKRAEKMQVAYINKFGSVCKELDLSLWEEGSGATTEDMVREINRAGKPFLEQLRNDNKGDLIFLCNVYSISVRTFIGNSYLEAPMLNPVEFNQLISYLDIELTKGRLPEKPGEILVDERMLKNLKKKVGDTIYNEETVITGCIKYDNYFAAGIDYEKTEYPDRYLFFVNNGTIPDLKKFFQTYEINADNDKFSEVQIVADKVNAIKVVDKFKDELDLPLNVMTYSILVVLSITLFFVYRLHVLDRYNEWCLYRSLGFSSKQVYFLAFREYGICLMFSFLFAIVMSVILCLFGGMLMNSRGMLFQYILPGTLFQIAGISVFLTGIMQLPVVYAMSKVRTIDAMEIE